MTRVHRPQHPPPANPPAPQARPFALATGRMGDELNRALPDALDDEQWALLYEAAEPHLGPRPADAEALAAAIMCHLQARIARGSPGAHLQALVAAMQHWTVAEWVAVTDATRRFWQRVDHDGLTTDPRHWTVGAATGRDGDPLEGS